jgi:hypothetical protein
MTTLPEPILKLQIFCVCHEMMSYRADSFLPTAGANKKASNVGHMKDGANVSKVEGTIVNQYIASLFF